MYHYHARPHRKADRPILFRRSTPTAQPENPPEDLLPDEQAFLAPAEETAPTDPQPEAETRLSLFDLQLFCLLLWGMQQQAEAEMAARTEAAETLIVESLPTVEQLTGGIPPARRRRAQPWPRALLVGCGAGLAALLSFVIGPLFTATTTTVTILPTQTTLTTTTIVTLATGTTKPPAPTIPGRELSTLTLSQARSAPTTGIGHEAAQAARGRVTFYNAALVAQTISAGTLLTGTDGTEIVTEQDAIVPAAQLPTDGQATVSAQAAQVGPQGNIGAGDLHGTCCRENVFVENNATFTGGQRARTYPMVTRHDLDSAVAVLTTALDQSLQAAYSAQLATNEALVIPVPCMSQVRSTHAVGNEAQTITVSLTDTCMGVAYDQQALQVTLLQHMTKQAQAQLGRGFTLLGDLQVKVQQVKQQGSALTLTVQGSGTWAYQFSEVDLQRLAALVAGKSAQQATTVLLHQPGISEVALSASALPANPDQIRLVVLYRPL